MPEIAIGDTWPTRPRARATADHRRRTRHLGDDRHQHLAAGRKVSGHKLLRDGEVPVGQRTGRQRLDPGGRYRPPGRLGGAGGRGELALAVLVEQMRREGFELTVGKPQVVTRTIDGKLHEPFEAMTIDCPRSSWAQSQADGQPQGPHGADDQSRRRVGADGLHRPQPRPHRFRTDFLTLTRGTGIANAVFDGYRPWAGRSRPATPDRWSATGPGSVTPFAMIQLADRGTFFVEPGDRDLRGPCRRYQPARRTSTSTSPGKKLTNMRSSTADVMETLARPWNSISSRPWSSARATGASRSPGDRPGAQGRPGRDHPGTHPFASKAQKGVIRAVVQGCAANRSIR